jgi:hypothetical protein
MTVQYTTQHITLSGLDLSVPHDFDEIISDLERHAKAIKHAVCDPERKIGGTLL